MREQKLAGPERTIFVNCPYRPGYQNLLEAQIFAIHALGYIAEAALGSPVSQRFPKLCSLIKKCGWSVHDLSLMTECVDGLPRLNVPFELGLVMGIHGSCGKVSKPCLVFDEVQDRYLFVLSDLRGFDDFKAHANNPANVIRELCGWVRRNSRDKLPNATQLLEQWEHYQRDRADVIQLFGTSPTHEFEEFRHVISDWLNGAISLHCAAERE